MAASAAAESKIKAPVKEKRWSSKAARRNRSCGDGLCPAPPSWFLGAGWEQQSWIKSSPLRIPSAKHPSLGVALVCEKHDKLLLREYKLRPS
jgi:hypothetical protein